MIVHHYSTQVKLPPASCFTRPPPLLPDPSLASSGFMPYPASRITCSGLATQTLQRVLLQVPACCPSTAPCMCMFLGLTLYSCTARVFQHQSTFYFCMHESTPSSAPPFSILHASTCQPAPALPSYVLPHAGFPIVDPFSSMHDDAAAF
jgi:hypothetical protein